VAILLGTDTCDSHCLLAMATLGDAIQIGSFLFMPCRPRCPRQVQVCHCRMSLSSVLSRNLRQHHLNHRDGS